MIEKQSVFFGSTVCGSVRFSPLCPQVSTANVWRHPDAYGGEVYSQQQRSSKEKQQETYGILQELDTKNKEKHQRNLRKDVANFTINVAMDYLVVNLLVLNVGNEGMIHAITIFMTIFSIIIPATPQQPIHSLRSAKSALQLSGYRHECLPRVLLNEVAKDHRGPEI